MKPPTSIVEGFFREAGTHPDKTAIVWKKQTFSYAEVSENVLRAAYFLISKGVKKGDRVAFYGDKTPLFAYTYLATHLIKAIAVPLDVKLPEDRLLYLLNLTEPSILLHPTKANDRFPQFPFSEELLETGMLEYYDFPKEDDVADILFTTGTTGNAKGVQLTHRNIQAGAVNSNEFIGNDSSDTEIIPLPLHHAFGLRRLRTNLMLGGTVILIDGFMFPKLFFEGIEKYGATGICMVPAGFSVVRKLSKNQYDLYFRNLKYIEFGSSPMKMNDKLELVERLPDTRICMHYGLTEVAANIFTEFHDAGKKLNSIGKPSPNVSIGILNENGEQLERGAIGEIAVKGDIQTPGYWQNPELTEAAFINGWFRTGDLGFEDEEGYIFLSGRKDDVINVGGKKVFPDEIENALNGHESIIDSVCISDIEGDDITGEKIKAFIVLEKGNLIPDSKQLTQFLRDRLEPYKIPAEYHVIEKIPLTSSGKKQRDKLK